MVGQRDYQLVTLKHPVEALANSSSSLDHARRGSQLAFRSLLRFEEVQLLQILSICDLPVRSADQL